MNATNLFWTTIITLQGPAPKSDANMDTLSKKITAIAAALTPIAWPILIISLTIVCLAMIASPVIPDWASGMKGTVMKACVAAILLTAIPTLVTVLQAASAVTGS